MNNRKTLANAHILIADSDRYMLTLLRQILRKMGFVNLTSARNSDEVMAAISKNDIDIVMTEWDMSPENGIRLIQALRHSEDSKLALLPVILVSGQATEEAVKYARDCGVTEFLTKPYSARTLYNRMEHVIEFPREFIVCDDYVGPDRRRQQREFDRQKDRRKTVPQQFGLASKIKRKYKSPVKIMIGNTLKSKMRIPKNLSDIITPEVIAEAQEEINNMRDESLAWIAEDVEILNECTNLIIEEHDPKGVSRMQCQLLRLKAHAGTFSFEHIEALAENIYQFLGHAFLLGEIKHHLALQKHIEVLQVLLAKRIYTADDIWAKRLLDGLDELLGNLKYSTPIIGADQPFHQDVMKIRV